MGTVTADTSPSFPATPSYGFVASPMYLVRVVEREGGYERVNRLWSRPLLRLTAVPLEDASAADIEEVLTFWHAMGGESTYFRVRDWSDYRTAAVDADITAADQPLVATVDSPGVYQLTKAYTSAGITQTREVYKPDGDTFRCSNELGVEQTDWTLDEANGLLTPGASFVGTPTAWGGEFDVEARFVGGLDIDIATYGTRNVRVAMREKRREPTT